jgi:hypothetical protein
MKIPISLFTEIEKSILTFTWGHKKCQIAEEQKEWAVLEVQ